MTNEKMTETKLSEEDYKLAEEYAECEQCAHCLNPQYCQGKEDCYDFDKVKCHFLAGLKADRPKWHKVADGDFPNDDRIVSDQEGNNVRYVKRLNKWFYRHRTCEAEVIAWCEIPKYTEE